MQSFKAIIFDVDGTLLNTDELYFQLLKLELRKLGILLTERKYGLFGLDDVIFHVGIDKKTAFKVRRNILKKYYSDDIIKKLRFKKGALKVIRLLSKKYKLAIASGEKIEQIERYLKYKNLTQYFQFIGHGGMVKNKKNDPKYFRLIAEFFNLKPEKCLMVGESIFDTEATKAGCSVVIIPSKFTKYCTFSKDCVILNDLKKLPFFLDSY